MEKRTLGKTNIEVSLIGIGTASMGPKGRARAFAEGSRLIQYAVENGIDFIDADESFIVYRYIRKALQDLGPSFPHPVISIKSPAGDYDGMSRAIDDCRKALDLDQIDVFMLQEVNSPQDFVSRAGAWECLGDAKSKGYIKAAGISTHDTGMTSEAAIIPGMDVLFSLINLSNPGVTAAVSAAAVNGLGVAAIGVLGGGALLKDYVKALDYATGLNGVCSVVVGMGCKKDVDDAIAYAEGHLPEGYTPEESISKMHIDRRLCVRCGKCVNYCTYKAFSLGDDGYPVIDTNKCKKCQFCFGICKPHAYLFL